MRFRRRFDLDRMNRAVAALDLPEPVFRTCPWQPRQLIDTGLRQWLRCAGVALADGQTVGMPSQAVDEAWHGFILCTVRYARFCDEAYGRFLHHHPDGAGAAVDGEARLRRTVVAWALVAAPGERCVLWDLDRHVGVERPWGLPAETVTAVTDTLGSRPGTNGMREDA